DLLRRRRRPEAVRDAAGLEHPVDQLAVRGRREAERELGGEAPHRLERAGQPRRPGRIALEHALDDDAVDLLGRLGEADALVHVPRPLRRAHAHHVPLRARVPAAAALLRERLPHVVPHLLGVDQDAVEVEDDSADHRPWYSRPKYTSAPRPGPCSTDCTSPTNTVWSPAAISSTVRACSQPTAPARRRGSSSRTSTP